MIDQEIHLFFIAMKSHVTRSVLLWVCSADRIMSVRHPCLVFCFFSPLPPFQVPKCLLFFRDSLWSVNTESQIAINNLYTPSFYVVKTWCMLQMMLRYLGWYVLFMVSHYFFLIFGCLGCVLFVLFLEIYFSLGPYWMEVSTWWY